MHAALHDDFNPSRVVGLDRGYAFKVDQMRAVNAKEGLGGESLLEVREPEVDEVVLGGGAQGYLIVGALHAFERLQRDGNDFCAITNKDPGKGSCLFQRLLGP